MARIFISYRRSDSSGLPAATVFEGLKRFFSEDEIYFDVSSNTAGDRWQDNIRNGVDKCAVLIAVVGPQYATGQGTENRLFDEADWVRREVTRALELGKPVIPVLAGASNFPELPPEMAALAALQWIRAERAPFPSDELARGIVKHAPELRDALRAVLSWEPEIWTEPRPLEHLYGRESDIVHLADAVLTRGRQVVLVHGPGGIGKTSVVLAALARVRAGEHFSRLYQINLENGQPAGDVVERLIRHFSQNTVSSLPPGVSERIAVVKRLMSEHRCIVILENAERVLANPGGDAGYRELVRNLSGQASGSVVFVTSREKLEVARDLEPGGEQHELRPIGADACRALVQVRAPNLSGEPGEWEAFSAAHGGNPLHLKLAADEALRLGFTAVSPYLAKFPAGALAELVSRHVQALSERERVMLATLAAARRPLRPGEAAATAAKAKDDDYDSAVSVLVRRYLAEVRDGGAVSLQPAVQEEVTALMSQWALAAIQLRTPGMLDRVPLIEVRAGEQVVEAQRRINVGRIAERAEANAGMTPRALGDAAETMLASLRGTSSGYAAGNIVNILGVVRGGELSNADFSGLVLRDVHLRDAVLRGASLKDTRVEGAVFGDTFGSIWMVAFSPDGASVASAGVTGEIRVWDARSGEVRTGFGRHTGWSFGLAYSSDGIWVASAGGDQEVRLWRTDTPAACDVLVGHASRVRAVAFHPVDHWLASASEDHRVFRWKRGFTSPSQPVELFRHGARLTALCFSGDGRWLFAAGGNGEICVWDTVSETLAAPIDTEGAEVRSIAASRDGRWIASVGDRETASIWRVGEWAAPTFELDAHAPLRSVALRGGDVPLAVLGGDDGVIRVWPADAEAPSNSWTAHANLVRSVDISPDGAQVASGGDDQTVRVFSAVGGGESVYKGYQCGARATAFAPGGGLLASGHDDAVIRLWNVETGQVRRRFAGHRSRIWSLAWSSDGERLASGGEDGAVKLWSGERDRPEWTRPAHSYRVFAVAVRAAAAGRADIVASAGADRTIRFWSLRTGESAGDPLTAHADRVRDIAFSASGEWLASGDETGRIIIWREDNGRWREAFALPGHKAAVTSLKFDLTGRRLFSGSEDRSLRVWNLREKKQARARENAHTRQVLTLDVSRDGKVIASGSEDGSVGLWRAEDLKPVFTHARHSDWVESVSFSADGLWLASASDDQNVHVTMVADGAHVSTLRDLPPYHGLNITGLTGISADQRSALEALGAVTEKA